MSSGLIVFGNKDEKLKLKLTSLGKLVLEVIDYGRETEV
jgi:hypothetical protein